MMNSFIQKIKKIVNSAPLIFLCSVLYYMYYDLDLHFLFKSPCEQQQLTWMDVVSEYIKTLV